MLLVAAPAEAVQATAVDAASDGLIAGVAGGGGREVVAGSGVCAHTHLPATETTAASAANPPHRTAMPRA